MRFPKRDKGYKQSRKIRWRYRPISEIIFLISLVPVWFLLSVDQNSSFMMITIARIWMIWTFWILPIVIIGKFLLNPTDDYAFVRPFAKKKMLPVMCIAIAIFFLQAFTEIKTKNDFTAIGVFFGTIILVCSHFYLKNKVSRGTRLGFEVMVSIYGFFFIFLVEYLKKL